MGNYTFFVKPPIISVLKKKSKDYYSVLLCKKAQFPNRSLTLKSEFDLTGEQLQTVYILLHTVCCEPYIKAFQYKVLNLYYILIPNYTGLDLPQTTTAPFVSLIPKPSAISFSTVYTRRLFGKSSNFISILFQKNLSFLL